ncbi:GGDEF domain-containing protein [Zavarzinia compransoris]|uniref:GGDEF domain-containing protein n=1 Tax=Zavarzinia marina TaxID=2911065 RepID=UPI001F1F0E1C|nr:GGDEF domain-containing protein [Zavarzinia marina]MCF4164386.1 GGDEF domain-containing protein [Zavarzinia marina]
MAPDRSKSRIAIRWTRRTAAPLAIAVFWGAVLIIIGLALDVEVLWRPLASGPATSLWSAAGIAVLAFALVPGRVGAVFSLAAVAISLLRFAELASGYSFLPTPSPWAEVLISEEAQGTPVIMGWNTALMIGLCGLGPLLMRLQLVSAAFACLMVAFGTAGVALLGYAYGQSDFHGEMAVPTMVLGGTICLATFFRYADRGWLRLMLGTSNSARAARQQISMITVGIIVIGLVFTRIGTQGSAEAMISMQAIILSTLVICGTAVGFRRVELAERHLLWKLHLQAIQDPLTGVYNRRGLMERLMRACIAAREGGRCFSVLAMDIDHFKSINDRFGHAAGDVVLCEVAKCIADLVREGDLFGRTGGEEFTVVAMDLIGRDAGACAERLRRGVEELDLEAIVPGLRRVTISIGIACTESCDGGLTDLMARADQALYRAKAKQRNVVSF